MSTGNTKYGQNALSQNNTVNSYSSAFGLQALQQSVNVNNTAVGAYSAMNTTSGISNVAFGKNSLQSNTTGSYNTALGTSAMSLGLTGNNNTGVGINALKSSNGTSNTGIGFNSMFSNKTGSGNVAVGMETLYSNVSSNFNTAVGTSSFRYGTGSNNTAIGAESQNNATTGSNNVSCGNNSLYSNKTGSNNTAIGFYASNSNPLYNSGNNNTSIGCQAAYNDVGNQNTFVGAFSDSTASISVTVMGESGFVNSTAIGYNAQINDDNQIMISSTSADVMLPGTLTVTGETNFATIPTAPTPTSNTTNNGQIATTAFVQSIFENPPNYYGYYAYCNGSNSTFSGTVLLNNDQNTTNYAVYCSYYYGYSEGADQYYSSGESSTALRPPVINKITATQFQWTFTMDNEIGDYTTVMSINIYLVFLVAYNSSNNFPKSY